MGNILFKEESYKIIGACISLHNKLGMGFNESVYQEALQIEFNAYNVPFENQPTLRIRYNNKYLNKYFRADFICFDKIIVEIKSVSFLTNEQNRQLLNYLKSTNLKLGILVNFGQPSLVYRRIVN